MSIGAANMEVPQKLKVGLLYGSPISLLGIYLKELKPQFTVVNICKQPKCP
jgi:hypothetical protein